MRLGEKTQVNSRKNESWKKYSKQWLVEGKQFSTIGVGKVLSLESLETFERNNRNNLKTKSNEKKGKYN